MEEGTCQVHDDTLPRSRTGMQGGLGGRRGWSSNASKVRRERWGLPLYCTYCVIVFRLAIDHHLFLNTYYKTLTCSISPLYRTVGKIEIV